MSNNKKQLLVTIGIVVLAISLLSFLPRKTQAPAKGKELAPVVKPEFPGTPSYPSPTSTPIIPTSTPTSTPTPTATPTPVERVIQPIRPTGTPAPTNVNSMEPKSTPMTTKYKSVKFNEAPFDEELNKRLICEKFGSNCAAALKIAYCESSYNHQVLNANDHPYPSVGLFQIMAFPNRGTVQQLLDINYNMDLAYKMSKGGTDWHQWVCGRLTGLNK